MRSKFVCTVIHDSGYSKQAELTTKYSDTPEDNEFSQATPNGNITITIDNPKTMGFLKPGKSYYVDFTEANE